jgi:segregation and condensation protein B
LFATTKAFLDDLGLRSLEELPPLESGAEPVPAAFELQFAATLASADGTQPVEGSPELSDATATAGASASGTDRQEMAPAP